LSQNLFVHFGTVVIEFCYDRHDCGIGRGQKYNSIGRKEMEGKQKKTGGKKPPAENPR
jgi:hypothetical protein